MHLNGIYNSLLPLNVNFTQVLLLHIMASREHYCTV